MKHFKLPRTESVSSDGESIVREYEPPGKTGRVGWVEGTATRLCIGTDIEFDSDIALPGHVAGTYKAEASLRVVLILPKNSPSTLLFYEW